MTMKTIKVNLYKFSELSEDAKQTAIEKLFISTIEANEYDFTEDGKLY